MIKLRGNLSDNDLTQSVKMLMSQSKDLKQEIFNHYVLKKNTDRHVFDNYVSFINELLRTWNNYADNVHKAIQFQDAPNTEVSAIPYGFVKNYIYAKYDYASILPYVDGLISGFEDKEFYDVKDIEEYNDYTLAKAFTGLDSNAGALVDNVLTSNGNVKMVPADQSEVALFNSCKSFDMFPRTDRKELFMSIEKIVTYMREEFESWYQLVPSMRIFITVINNIVDYIIFSVTAFITRIYIISVYINNYIDISNITESTDAKKDESDKPIIVLKDDFFRNMDEGFCSQIENFGKFQKALCKWYCANDGHGTLSTYSINTENMNDKNFANAISNSVLYKYLYRRDYDYDNPLQVDEIRNILRSFIYDEKPAMLDVTASQNLVAIIRSAKPESNTLEGYRKLGKDMCIVANNLGSYITRFIKEFMSRKKRAQEEPGGLPTIGELKATSEIIRMLEKLYHQIVFVSIAKLRDIEMNVNILENKHVRETMQNFKIQLPGEKHTDGFTGNMDMAVPDVSKITGEVMMLYGNAVNDFYEMYNQYVIDYLKENNQYDEEYFKEEGEAGGIINAIIAFIKSIFNKIRNFFSNDRVRAAIKWVKDNRNKLNSINEETFNTHKGDLNIDYLPYKQKINLGFADNLKKNLTNIKANLATIVKQSDNEKGQFSETPFGKKIKELYDTLIGGSSTIQTTSGTTFSGKEISKLFDKEGKPLQNKNNETINPAKIIKALILYDKVRYSESDENKDIDDSNMINIIDPKPVHLSFADKGVNDLQSLCNTWVDTIMDAENMQKQLNNYGNDITNIISEIQRDVTNHNQGNDASNRYMNSSLIFEKLSNVCRNTIGALGSINEVFLNQYEYLRAVANSGMLGKPESANESENS